MDATTVCDLFGRERRSDRVALADRTGREYDYHWLCTSAWKAGNFLRHAGVRRGVTVGVAGDGPLALLAFFGTALLEGTTRFEPPTDLEDRSAIRAVVAPADEVGRYDLPGGAQRVGYGGEPDEPAVHHLDAGLWSENPSFPPVDTDPGTPLLTDGELTHSHGDVLAAARGVADEYGIDAGTRVALRTSPANPRAVAAGVIAPLLAGGTVVLPGAEGTESRADLVVSPVDGSDVRRVSPASVEIP